MGIGARKRLACVQQVVILVLGRAKTGRDRCNVSKERGESARTSKRQRRRHLRNSKRSGNVFSLTFRPTLVAAIRAFRGDVSGSTSRASWTRSECPKYDVRLVSQPSSPLRNDSNGRCCITCALFPIHANLDADQFRFLSARPGGVRTWSCSFQRKREKLDREW